MIGTRSGSLLKGLRFDAVWLCVYTRVGVPGGVSLPCLTHSI